MFRKSLTPLLAAAFLVAPAMLPSAFVSAIAPGLSGSAQAVTNLNSSRSNIYRKKHSKALGPRKGNTGQNGGGARRDEGQDVELGVGSPHRARGGGGGGGGGVSRMGGGGGGRGAVQ
jgi:hypothetical protein